MQDDTILVHGIQGVEEKTGAISFPIFQTATFRHEALYKSTGFDYSRGGNPTRQELERLIAKLESGVGALAFSSGMAAISTVFHLLKPGQHVLLSQDLYGGTYRLAAESYKPFGIEFEYIDTSDCELVSTHIRDNTSMIFIETPSNPMMTVTDIADIKNRIKGTEISLVVDNTFLTPYYQKPLLLGADIVVHSGTKYLCGHNDVMAGFLIVKDESLLQRFTRISMTEGANLAPMDSWLMIRSLKTLGVRLEKQVENAGGLVSFLLESPFVQQVYYTGIPSHPGYEVNKKQAKSAGAMISFRVKNAAWIPQILQSVKVFYFAESLGGVESLITYPLVQTHAEIPPNMREETGLDDCLLRLSVGIEDIEDLISDLEQAFLSCK